MGAISIHDVTLKYDSYVVFQDLNENIFDGEFFVILGASGSGKTAFLKVITGLALLYSGYVEVGGKNINRFSQKQMLDYHKNCGFVFQNSALISNMSIYENLSLYYNYHTDMTEKEIDDRISEILEYVGYHEDVNVRPNALSIGERMQISIARAISHDPEYVFWDNPMAMLDAIYQRKVRNIIQDLKKKNKTMVMVTNDAGYALKEASRIGILYRGKIIESGSPDDIRNSGQEITQELLSG